jgi:uncharacterized phage-associated protein
MADWYNSRKAGQIAAFFARRQGGSINILKLVKLIYLSERDFLRAYDSSMLNDHLVSMDNGPVNSRTLDKINAFSADNGWSDFVSDRSNHMVGLVNPAIADDDLNELSRAELKTLAGVWDQFGHMTQWQLVDYTHEHCPEWEDPHGSSNPIPYERVFKALGKQKAGELDRKIIDDRKLFSALRD